MALKKLGSKITIYKDEYDPDLLEYFINPQQRYSYEIEITAPEVTCLCPKTGQPDFAEIYVRYSPLRYCLESKSFKLYLFSYRQTGIFHEAMTNLIADDLYTVLKPKWLEVQGRFAPRGGIKFWPKVRRGEY